MRAWERAQVAGLDTLLPVVLTPITRPWFGRAAVLKTGN
jgi:hypothetical protein